MTSGLLFPRPAFVSEFINFDAFRVGRIGITGHRGVLGGILYRRLLNADVAIEAYEGDINDNVAWGKWIEAHRFTRFFHFAAIVPVTRVEANPLLAYETNVMSALRVCQSILATQKDCWFFHASSSHVYRPNAGMDAVAETAVTEPQTFYGATKLAAEQAIRPILDRMQAQYCIGRVFSFSHSNQSEPYLVPSLRSKIEKLVDGDTLDIVNPSSVRDIQDAETVIDCILHLASRCATGTLNIGSGHGLSVREIALAIARQAKKQVNVQGVDKEQPGSLIANTQKLRHALEYGEARKDG